MFWLSWLGKNPSVLIAVIALIVSILAIRVTAKEFRLRVRPYVGVMKIKPIAVEGDKDAMKFELELVNVGILPAIISHYSLDYFVDDIKQEGKGINRNVNLVLLPQQKYPVTSQKIGNLTAALFIIKKGFLNQRAFWVFWIKWLCNSAISDNGTKPARDGIPSLAGYFTMNREMIEIYQN